MSTHNVSFHAEKLKKKGLDISDELSPNISLIFYENYLKLSPNIFQKRELAILCLETILKKNQVLFSVKNINI